MGCYVVLAWDCYGAVCRGDGSNFVTHIPVDFSTKFRQLNFKSLKTLLKIQLYYCPLDIFYICTLSVYVKKMGSLTLQGFEKIMNMCLIFEKCQIRPKTDKDSWI